MSAALTTLIQSNYKPKTLRAMREPCRELSNRIQVQTPVDTGRARKGWTPSINAPDFSERGGDPIKVVAQLQPGDSYFYANGVPYIRPLDNGHSAQAPNGMFKVNVANWANIVAMYS